jgi:serine/threonine protein kinase
MGEGGQGSACIRCGNHGDVGRFCPHCGADQTPAPPPVDPLVGTTIAERYTIVELLGVGGMARVYRARHQLLDREVAVKLMHPELLLSEESVPRFIAEARAASRLNHPNVVSIFDFGVAAGNQTYLVMELLGGTDLAALLKNEGLPTFARGADILRQVLSALHEAHELGITHRDIKPENIIVERGRRGEDRVKVIDFGIAKASAHVPIGRRLTRQGQLVGTPHYMAPEQIRGEAGPSVDLYAVGVCLFEMLTGAMPFDGETTTSVLDMHLKAERPNPRIIAPHRGIPAALAEVCVRALDLDPARRFPSAQALAQAITSAATSEAWTPLHETLFPTKSL